MTQDQFLNALCILYSIDGWQLPELLNGEQQRAFVRNPVDYFLRAPDAQQAAIWREIEKRQKE